MASIDTVLCSVTNQVALAAVTVANGDTLSVRNFAQPNQAFLENITLKGGQAVIGRVLSPYLHDTTRGITVTSAQAPTLRTLPRQAAQSLSAQDTLGVTCTSGGANSSILALHNYYTDLGASDARLYNWGDISGLIGQIKPLEVDAAASATIGQWADTLITATETLLKANTDYAVLGYTVDVACAVIAVKGQDTGSLRIGAPGTPLQDVTAEYFVEQSIQTGRAHIPVINAANAGNTSVSVGDNAASTAVKVQLILAELTHNLS